MKCFNHYSIYKFSIEYEYLLFPISKKQKKIQNFKRVESQGTQKVFFVPNILLKMLLLCKIPLSTTDYSMYYYLFKDLALFEKLRTSSRHKRGLNSSCE